MSAFRRPGRPLTVPFRPARGRMIGGVCAALAARFRLDVTWLRIAFVVLALASGVGLVLYGAAWLLLPDEDRSPPLDLRDAVRGNLRGASQAFRRHVGRRELGRLSSSDPRRRSLAVVALGVGAAIFLGSLGALRWLSPTRALGLGLVALGLAALLQLRRENEGRHER